jgi:hypothetical protein
MDELLAKLNELKIKASESQELINRVEDMAQLIYTWPDEGQQLLKGQLGPLWAPMAPMLTQYPHDALFAQAEATLAFITDRGQMDIEE